VAALLGKREEFRRSVEALQRLSLEDHFVEPSNTYVIATGHLILGDEESALKHLATIMTGPSPTNVGPHSIRLDPIWSRMNGNPRFEEILKNAKPL
jgi:hypothetical protein